jgi:hypothetical protein
MLPPEERNDHSAHRPGVVWGPRVIVPIPSGDAERHAWAGWKYLLPPSDLIILLCRFTC